MLPRRIAPGGWWVAALILSTPLAWTAWRFREMSHLGHLHDDSVYFVTAKSLAEGRGYRIQSLPGELPQTKYPPVVPALFSLVWRIEPHYPDNLPIAMFLAWLPLPLALWLAALHYHRFGLSPLERIAALAAVASSATTGFLATSVYSEIWFTVFALAALLIAERAGSGLIAGGLAGVAVLTRIAGAPILVTAPLILWRTRRKRDAILFLAASVPFAAAWSLWVRQHPAPLNPVSRYYTFGDYAQIVAGGLSLLHYANMVLYNVSAFGLSMGELLIPGVGDSYAGRCLAVILGAAGVCGVWRIAKETGVLQYPAFAAGLSALLIFWVYPPTTRLLWPLFPILAAGVVRQGRHMASLARLSLSRGGADRVAGVISAGLLITAVVFWAAQSWRTVSTGTPNLLETDRSLYLEMKPAREWIRANVPQDAIVLAYFDAILYLETGHRATRLSLNASGGDIQVLIEQAADPAAFMRSAGIRYLLVTPADFHADFEQAASSQARAEIGRRQRASSSFETLWSSGPYAVLRLR